MFDLVIIGWFLGVNSDIIYWLIGCHYKLDFSIIEKIWTDLERMMHLLMFNHNSRRFPFLDQFMY